MFFVFLLFKNMLYIFVVECSYYIFHLTKLLNTIMKKSRFLPIMIGLTFVTLILSCNNDNTSKTTDEEAVSIEQLFTNIDEYNTLFCKENNVDMTRATREQRRYKRQIVAQADAGGVISGLIVGGAVGVGSLPLAIIGGVIGSMLVAINIDADDLVVPTASAMNNKPQTYIGVVLGDNYDEVGFLHNKIIADMFDKYGYDFIAQADERTLFMITLEELEYNGYNVSSIKTDLEANYIIVKDIADLLKVGNFDGITARIATTYPQLSEEVAVLDMYVGMYDILPEDTTLDYTVGLRQVIENAAISDKSKTVIRAGISTAFGSENLWFN